MPKRGPEPSGATPGGIPRPFELVIAAGGLLATMPVIAGAAILVRLSSRGGAFFRQLRVGRGGKGFTLYKLRTMTAEDGGPMVTASGDKRVTRVGRLLRWTKIDELPQLWNVFCGHMSLVGPRPEVPKYVNPEDPDWRSILRVRPGITDPVTLKLRDEEALLARVPGDRELYYREVLLPFKMRESLEYLQKRSWRTDVAVLWRTVVAICFRPKGEHQDLWPAALEGGSSAGPEH